MAVTVADVLAMPVLRNAQPVVLAGGAGVGHEVRWVHTTELPDIGPLLRGGDLVLTTGIALPEASDALAGFAESLWESRAAGLVVELGRRWADVPPPLAEACERVGLPLVALQREVRFASVAQAVGERIVDEQLDELRASRQVHETFTELTIAEAGPGEILDAVASLARATAVIESGQHRVLDFRAGPRDPAEFLDDWERRSRAVRPVGRTAWDESSGWLVTQVGRPERGWGRLVIECPHPPTERLVAVAERGAAALAQHRLHDRHRDGQARRLHHELLVALAADPTGADLERRCRLAGLPTERRAFVGLAIRDAGSRRSGTPAVDEIVSAVLHAAAVAGVPALVTVLDDEVRALLSLTVRADPERVVDDLAVRVARAHPVVVAAGSPADALGAADRTLAEAHQVLRAAASREAGPSVHRLHDVHVRGLIALMRDDDRLRTFAARELAALRRADTTYGGRLEAALRATLAHPTSKAGAARALAVSRPVLYERLAAVERVLEVDLSDAEVRTSLHLALLVDELVEKSD